jgi:hypothetical protein
VGLAWRAACVRASGEGGQSLDITRGYGRETVRIVSGFANRARKITRSACYRRYVALVHTESGKCFVGRAVMPADVRFGAVPGWRRLSAWYLPSGFAKEFAAERSPAAFASGRVPA